MAAVPTRDEAVMRMTPVPHAEDVVLVRRSAVRLDPASECQDTRAFVFTAQFACPGRPGDIMGVGSTSASAVSDLYRLLPGPVEPVRVLTAVPDLSPLG